MTQFQTRSPGYLTLSAPTLEAARAQAADPSYYPIGAEVVTIENGCETSTVHVSHGRGPDCYNCNCTTRCERYT